MTFCKNIFQLSVMYSGNHTSRPNNPVGEQDNPTEVSETKFQTSKLRSEMDTAEYQKIVNKKIWH